MSNQQIDLSQFKGKIPELNLGAIKWIFVLGIIVSALWTSIYSIAADSRGIILRFGKMQPDKIPPGLHVKLPFGIHRV